MYQEIYYLSTLIGFGNAEYIEALTPVERKLYWSYYVRDEKLKEKKTKGDVFDINSPNLPKGINIAGGIANG